MKKLLLLLATMPILMSCVESSDNSTEVDIPADKPFELSDLAGVWMKDTNGKVGDKGVYFMSFTNDGYCTMYLRENFMEDGDLSIVNADIKELKLTNALMNRVSTIKISNLSERSITLSLDSKTYPYSSDPDDTEPVWTTLTLTKVDHYEPSKKTHPLVGRLISSWVTMAGWGTPSIKFDIYNSATITENKSVKPNSKQCHYFFINNFVFWHWSPANTGQDKTKQYITKLTNANGYWEIDYD